MKGKPVYYALSYAWGNTAMAKYIQCNGRRLDISTNLYEAIQTLFSRPLSQKSPIWIDAICINQKNSDEKGVQVRHMGDIFRQACQVVVWLGPSAHNSDYAMDKFEWLTEILTSITLPPEHSTVSEFGLPDRDDKLWSALGFLFRREWFSRLWTFQEVVLAADFKFICGNKSVVGDSFMKVATGLWRLGLRNLCFEYRPVEDHEDGFTAMEQVRVARNDIANYGRIHFAYLLGTAAYKLCFDPRDKVYGMLGIAPESFRKRIPISYFDDAKDGAVKTYINCAKACIEESLTAILELVSGRPRLSGLPSWCPNLGSATKLSLFDGDNSAGVSENEGSQFTAKTRPGTDILAIMGFRVGKVSEVIEETLRFNQNASSGWAKTALNWETSCLELARMTISPPLNSDIIPNDHILTLTANSHPKFPIEQDGSYYQAYLDVMVHLRHVTASGQDAFPPIERQPLFHKVYSRIFEQYAGHRYFSTVDGRLGLGPPDTKLGDTVCVLYGAEVLFILREADETAEDWTLLGGAFVSGLMHLEETLKDPKIKVAPEVFNII